MNDQQILDYQRDHKFEREKFIAQIRMMHKVSVDLNEKPRIKSKDIDNLESAPDIQLVKVHKFYWDKL